VPHDVGGYFAVNRKIFDHPLFCSRPEWHRAWEWLIAGAAYCDRTKRLSSRLVELQRGQLATTVRALAEEWGWSKSNVDYFLRRLEDEGMIVRARTRTKSRTSFGTRNSHTATLVTICNYDKFQSPSTGVCSVPGQVFGQVLGQENQQAFVFPAEPASQPSNHTTKEQESKRDEKRELVVEERAGAPGRRTKPPHGSKSKDGKFIWFDHDTDEWRVYASDYAEVRGAALCPENRMGGPGNWFVKLGEASRPINNRRPKQWTKTISTAKPVLAPQHAKPTMNSNDDAPPLASVAGT